MKRLIASVLIGIASHAVAFAEEKPDFRGKQITMIIGSPPGGGTDLSGRLLASYISSYLPGKPAPIVRNMPGAQGITAMNYMARQVQPDGMTIVMASTTQGDPLFYRKPTSQFDPTKFNVIGGIGRGGTVLIIRKDAEARLYDKTQPPVIMGALGVPRSGMQTTAWGVAFLDWNAKWVVGYPSTNELLFALERGEIDMTADGNVSYIFKLMETGKFKLITQSGSIRSGKLVARSEFAGAPLFADLMKGRIKDPAQQRAFEYWSSLTALDKWVALPPGVSEPYISAYRDAFLAATKDPEFADQGKRVSEDFEPMSHEDVSLLIQRLGATAPTEIDFVARMLKQQGLDTN